MDVSVEDLLQSMSQSLIAVKPKLKHVTDLPDRRFEIKLHPKPPKEMFYRKTLIVESRPEIKLLPEVCSCKFVCFGAKATLKCLNCAVFDPLGLGYYCDKCFEAKHPWYRVAHIVAPIYRNENIRESIQKQEAKLQADRRRIESHQIIDKLKQNQFKLTLVADDLQVDTSLRCAARKSVGLESKVYQIRKRLRFEIRSAGGISEMTPQEAAMAMQTCYRGYKIRSLISRAYAERTVIVWDKTVGREYYFDKYLGASSWTPPVLIMKKHLATLTTVDLQDPNRLIWICKKTDTRCRSLPVHELDDASTVILGFFRCISARKRTMRVALSVYFRVYDEDYNTHFYVNQRTGDSTWTKPRVLLTNEPMIFLSEDQKKLKRSPRWNRERLEIEEGSNSSSKSSDHQNPTD